MNTPNSSFTSRLSRMQAEFAGSVRRRRWPLALAGAVVVVAAAAFAALHWKKKLHPLELLRHAESVAELKRDVKKDPKDSHSRVELGHALFAQGKRAQALRVYERALLLDKDAGDEAMYGNLVACFGHPEQPEATAIVTRFKLTQTGKGLKHLASHDADYKVRWSALQTLDKLGLASRSDFVHAWMEDLGEKDCDVRKRAVEGLGKEGDHRAIAALREAKKKDQKSKTWFLGPTCLGSSPDEAEKRILARK